MSDAIMVKTLKKELDGRKIIDGVSFVVEEGTVAALFGPNGCGKSTLLNILSGLTDYDGGEYYIKNFEPSRFSYIFQNYRQSLLPWLTNMENILLPLRLQKKHPLYITQKINYIRQNVKNDFALDSYPYKLSGGQQQMVAFWRALITEPKILFIDEPFSALDIGNNARLRRLLLEYHKENNPTILIVSHDIEEILSIADKIIMLSDAPTKTYEILPNQKTDTACRTNPNFGVLERDVQHWTNR